MSVLVVTHLQLKTSCSCGLWLSHSCKYQTDLAEDRCVGHTQGGGWEAGVVEEQGGASVMPRLRFPKTVPSNVSLQS